jgi:hypothetical protein
MRGNRNCMGLRYWLLGLFACWGWVSASGADSVAMLTDLQGKVTLAGDSKAPPLSILSELKQGARVQLGAGARAAVVYLDSGQEFDLVGPAEVQFEADHPQSIKGTAPRKHGAALTRSQEAIRINPVQVTQAAIVMRSIEPSRKLKLLSLSDTTTLDLRPTFQWQRPQSGLHYQIALLDDTGKPLFDTTTDGLSVQLPDNVPLQAGVAYTWVVSAKDAAGKAWSNAGDFSLASADLRAQVDRLRPAADAPLSERVVFAAWLEQMHLRDEARKLWKGIAAERQDDARLKVLAGE